MLNGERNAVVPGAVVGPEYRDAGGRVWQRHSADIFGSGDIGGLPAGARNGHSSASFRHRILSAMATA